MGGVEDLFGLAGTTLERRFAIERVVARGGFGVVYRGRHITLNKPVAIKVLAVPQGLSPHEKKLFLEGFEQEARTLAALEHPAIVRAIDFGIARPPGRRELPWLALEWIDGASLAQWLEARGGRPVTPAEALALLRPVMEGLAFAHGHRVAHRDIKPANVMLTSDPAAPRAGSATARLVDFGIAKVMAAEERVGSGATRTLSAYTAFSAPYAAPEQQLGHKTGPWTDVHALGLVLTEMLTGSPPYPGDDPAQVGLRVVAPTRPTPALFGVDVGPWEPVLARAVALPPPERFQDAGSFLAALEAALQPAPAREVPMHAPTIREAPVYAPTALPVLAQAPAAAVAATLATVPPPAPRAPPAAPVPRGSRRGVVFALLGGVGLVALGVVLRVALGPGSSTASAPSATGTAGGEVPPEAWARLLQQMEPQEAAADQYEQEALALDARDPVRAQMLRHQARMLRAANDQVIASHDAIAATYAATQPGVAATNRELARRGREHLRQRRSRGPAPGR